MIFRKEVTAVLVLSTVLIFSACVKNNKDQYFGSYFPLQVGNTWIYELTDSSEFSTDARISKLTINITKDTLINNYPAVIVEQSYSGGGRSRMVWYEKDNQLIERYTNATWEHVLYKNPIQIGDTMSDRKVNKYYSKYPVPFGAAPAFAISSGDDIVKDGQSTGYYYEDVYAPNIGRVAYTQIQNYYGFGISTWRLTDYYID